MTEILRRFVGWLFPERAARRAILDEFRLEFERLTKTVSEEYAKREAMEARLQRLEKRFEKESCLRFACKHRLTLNELPPASCTDNGADIYGAGNPYRHDLPLEQRYGLSD